MSWIVADSFDYYGSTNDLSRSVWDSVNFFAPAFTTGRFGAPGQALELQGTHLYKTISPAASTIYVACATYRTSGSNANALIIRLYAGGTIQCTIWINGSTNNVEIHQGDTGGTLLGSFPFQNDLWTHWQFQVVMGAGGSFTLRKNGVPTNTYAVTGLNLGSPITQIEFTANDVNYVDDILVYSGDATAPNTWVGDVRGVCQNAAFDTAQKNFASTVTTPTVVDTVTNGTGAQSFAANVIVGGQMTAPSKTLGITKATLSLVSGVTGHIQAALYKADGPVIYSGGPGAPWNPTLGPKTLVAVSAVVTNPGAGNVDFTFSNCAVVSGAAYWMCFLSDVAFNNTSHSWVWGPGGGWTFAQAYASGFPASMGAVTFVAGSGANPEVTYTCSYLNAQAVGDALANGDTDYVLSATVNDEDLYGVLPLQVTPFAIIGVVSKVYIRKSDAGTRQGQLRVKSGATEVAGVDTAVSSTWSYLSRVDAVDPNTSAAWTLAAVNALQVGQKVTL